MTPKFDALCEQLLKELLTPIAKRKDAGPSSPPSPTAATAKPKSRYWEPGKEKTFAVRGFRGGANLSASKRSKISPYSQYKIDGHSTHKSKKDPFQAGIGLGVGGYNPQGGHRTPGTVVNSKQGRMRISHNTSTGYRVRPALTQDYTAIKDKYAK